MDNSVKKIGVTIVGGSGFGAGELLRLLSYHPEAEVVSVVSRREDKMLVRQLHPNLATQYSTLQTSLFHLPPLLKFDRAVVFLALPTGISGEWIKEHWDELVQAEVRLVDLSGDFRLKNQAWHEHAYPEVEFSPAVREKFVYGLPELQGQMIAHAKCVSNPGCYATACTLALAPLVTQGYAGKVFLDAKSGSSGAGKEAGEKFLHANLHGNMFAYKVLCHRHEPEIRQCLQGLNKYQEHKVDLFLVPQVIPTARGISVTAYLSLPSAVSAEQLRNTYEEFYQNTPFVRVVDNPPALSQVVGSNYCDLYVTTRGCEVVIISMLDNLVKGMAGQAIQNMNLMFGLDEKCGLEHPALG